MWRKPCPTPPAQAWSGFYATTIIRSADPRSEPAGGDVGRYPASRRRELRAHLSPELRQHRDYDNDRLLGARPHPGKRGDPARGVPHRPRSAHSGHHPLGGLLPYIKANLADMHHSAPEETRMDAWPLTLGKKIIARNKVFPDGHVSPGDGVFLTADWRFCRDYFTGMCAYIMRRAFGDNLTLERPDQIIAFQDHLVLASE